MSETVEITQVNAVALLAPYNRYRREEAGARESKDIAGRRIKAYLEANPEERLYDGETGLEGFLTSRRGGDTFDVASMPLALVKALWKANALQVDTKVLDALRGKSIVPTDCEPYRIPGGITVSLNVKDAHG